MASPRNTSWPKLVASLALILLCQACSPASYTSTEGAIGGLSGAAIGSGVGYLLGNEVGNMGKNIALNSAIGAGIGLLGGAMLHDRNLEVERQREIVKREAELIDENQRELDLLREGLNEQTSWGGNETKPWQLRYPAEDLDTPYQGPDIYRRPGSNR